MVESNQKQNNKSLLTGHPVKPLVTYGEVANIRAGLKVYSYWEVSSTNDIAWTYAGGDSGFGVLVLAETQTNGRGRFANRKWHDKPGGSILMSILIPADYVEADILSILSGIALVEAILDVTSLSPEIKWPNDIILENQKVAGLMVEAKEISGRKWYVLGVGVNCNQLESDFPDELSGKSTSIKIQTGRDIDRGRIVLSFIDKLFIQIEKGFARELISENWQKYSYLDGKMVTLASNGVEYSGIIKKINPFTEISMVIDNGIEKTFDPQKCTVLAF